MCFGFRVDCGCGYCLAGVRRDVSWTYEPYHGRPSLQTLTFSAEISGIMERRAYQTQQIFRLALELA